MLSEFNPTPEQIANLNKLADFLDKAPFEPEQFKMRAYYRAGIHHSHYPYNLGPGKITNIKHRCGTSACAIGWGPVATGIRPKKDEFWSGYARRVFGTNDYCTRAGINMFDSSKPNCPHQAAQRIRKELQLLERRKNELA